MAGDWVTFGGDPQRSGWAKDEKVLTRESVKGLKLLWSVKVPNEPKELTSLTAALGLQQVITGKGFFELAFVGGSSDAIYAIDVDAGKIFWQRKFEVQGAPKGQPHWLCPFSLNATPVIDKKERLLYAVASDGRLHTLQVTNGEEAGEPVPFTPPFAKPYSLNLVNGVLYAFTGQGCNASKNGIYAIDLKTKAVSVFRSTTVGGAGLWGRGGPAVGFDGRVYGETGDGPYDVSQGRYADTFLSLTPGDLKLADYYTPANRAWITKKDLDMGSSSAVVFKYKDREIVAGGGKEGVLYLLDAKQLGGADHRTPLYRSPLLANEDVDFAGRGFWGAQSTWEDAEGTRWLYAPVMGPPTKETKFEKAYGETPHGSIMAFRVEEKAGQVQLTPAWNSVDMNVPEPVAIANGVVFAVASGDYVRQVTDDGRILSSKDRIGQVKENAVLYALDAKTGEVIYSSKDAIKGWTHFSGLAIAGGHVYVTTWDSTVHCFGIEQ